MLRAVSSVVRGLATRAVGGNVTNSIIPTQLPVVNIATRCFGAFSPYIESHVNRVQYPINIVPKNTPTNVILPPSHITVPSRTVTKFSLQKGKRKSVKTVLKRFFRLNWGIWIRARAGSKKHLWKKKENRRWRLRKHVFTNATQSWLLDKMVTSYWRRPRYHVDDPYNPYHTREEFPFTRKKPLP